MSGYLLDTNCLSELVRLKPERRELRARFFGRILPVDIAVADRWGLLAAQTKAKGKPLSIIDGLLAATSLHYNLTLVTRNTKDVIATGVATLDPWDS